VIGQIPVRCRSATIFGPVCDRESVMELGLYGYSLGVRQTRRSSLKAIRRHRTSAPDRSFTGVVNHGAVHEPRHLRLRRHIVKLSTRVIGASSPGKDEPLSLIPGIDSRDQGRAQDSTKLNEQLRTQVINTSMIAYMYSQHCISKTTVL